MFGIFYSIKSALRVSSRSSLPFFPPPPFASDPRPIGGGPNRWNSSAVLPAPFSTAPACSRKQEFPGKNLIPASIVPVKLCATLDRNGGLVTLPARDVSSPSRADFPHAPSLRRRRAPAFCPLAPPSLAAKRGVGVNPCDQGDHDFYPPSAYISLRVSTNPRLVAGPNLFLPFVGTVTWTGSDADRSDSSLFISNQPVRINPIPYHVRVLLRREPHGRLALPGHYFLDPTHDRGSRAQAGPAWLGHLCGWRSWLRTPRCSGWCATASRIRPAPRSRRSDGCSRCASQSGELIHVPPGPQAASATRSSSGVSSFRCSPLFVARRWSSRGTSPA